MYDEEKADYEADFQRRNKDRFDCAYCGVVIMEYEDYGETDNGEPLCMDCYYAYIKEQEVDE